LRIVSEQLADLAHTDGQRRIADHDFGPHGLEEFFFGDQAPGAVGEVLQDGERLRPQTKLVRIAPDGLRQRIQPERTEGIRK
jgi:hypothetical protein